LLHAQLHLRSPRLETLGRPPDITRTIKTKGEFGSDGSSKIGIGVELDY